MKNFQDNTNQGETYRSSEQETIFFVQYEHSISNRWPFGSDIYFIFAHTQTKFMTGKSSVSGLSGDGVSIVGSVEFHGEGMAAFFMEDN